MNATDSAIDALATYRLTRLLTRDTITARMRGALVLASYRAERPSMVAAIAVTNGDTMPLDAWADMPRKDDDAPTWAKFVTCPWCVGVWVAFGVVTVRAAAPRAWDPIARALAAAAVTGLAATYEG